MNHIVIQIIIYLSLTKKSQDIIIIKNDMIIYILHFLKVKKINLVKFWFKYLDYPLPPLAIFVGKKMGEKSANSRKNVNNKKIVKKIEITNLKEKGYS